MFKEVLLYKSIWNQYFVYLRAKIDIFLNIYYYVKNKKKWSAKRKF